VPQPRLTDDEEDSSHPNQIITTLREVEAARAEGRIVAAAVRDIGATEPTDCREAGVRNDGSRSTQAAEES
jgi:hypothetical protein